MASPKGHPVPQTMDDWMRSQEKRTMHEERRPRVATAQDLLGPGFGPRATRISDWNVEEARFNGFFWSTGDALNTPAANYMAWMGLAITTGHHTVQVLWSHGSAPTLAFTRQIHVHANEMPSFMPWEPLGGGLVADDETGVLQDITIEDLTLTGFSRLLQNGGLLLESGVTNPTSGPLLTPDYDTRSTHGGFSPRGFEWFAEGDVFLRTETVAGGHLQVILDKGNDYDFGWSNFSLVEHLGHTEVVSALGGVATVGDHAYLLCETAESWKPGFFGYPWFIFELQFEGWDKPTPERWSYVRRWAYYNYTQTTTLGPESPHRPVIAPDNGALTVAQASTTGAITLTHYNTDAQRTGTKRLRNTNNTDWVSGAHCLGLVCGPADSGGAVQYWLQQAGTRWIRAFDSTGMRVPEWDFEQPTSAALAGLYWDGLRFRSATETQVHHYSEVLDEPAVAAVQTWRVADANPPDYASAETAASPAAAGTWKERAFLRATAVGPLPSGADAVGIYLSTDGGPFRRLPPPAAGQMSVVVEEPPATGDTPPLTASGFEGGTPAAVSSNEGGFWVDGASNGDVGAGSFRASVQAAAGAYSEDPLTLAAGWAQWAGGTAPLIRVYEATGMVFVSLDLERTGATLTADADGNITDTLITTLPVSPVANHWPTLASHLRPPWAAVINDLAQILVTSGPPGGSIATGQRWRLSTVFPSA